jgi:hypothetical protein
MTFEGRNMTKFSIKINLLAAFVSVLFTVQNAKADIFAFQNTPPSQLWTNNQKGASYLSLNGICLMPGSSKYNGPNWTGDPGFGATLKYGRCFIDNIGVDLEVTYGAINAEYNDKADKGVFGKIGGNASFDIFGGAMLDNHDNISHSKPAVSLSIGYGWNGYSFGFQNTIDTAISGYTQPSFNFEDSWYDIPFVLKSNFHILRGVDVQPYFKIVYQNNSLYYCVPVVEYDSGAGEYRWNSQEYEQTKDIWVFDYGVVLGVAPFKHKKTIKLFTGCGISKSSDQEENNISLSFGLLKEWGKKFN